MNKTIRWLAEAPIYIVAALWITWPIWLFIILYVIHPDLAWTFAICFGVGFILGRCCG